MSVEASTGRTDVASVAGTAQTGNDNGLDINTLITQIGTAGDGLTAIDLPNQTMDITGSVSGSVGNVAGNVDGNVTGSVGSLTGHTVQTGDNYTRIGIGGIGLTHLATAGNLTTVDTIVDSILAMLDNPRSEPSQGAPAVNADAMTKLDYLYKFMRNKIVTGTTTIQIYDDAGTTIDHASTISAAGSTFTRGEFLTGA